MSDLNKALTYIAKNKEAIIYALQSKKNKGHSFETILKKIFINKGNFKNVKPKENDKVINILNELKGSILDHKSTTLIDNTFDLKNCVIYQPFGTQSFPDFLIFTEKHVFTVEAKFVSKTEVPFWNGSFPKLDTIYIFGKLSTNDITFSLGNDLCSAHERKLLCDAIDKMQEFFEKLNNDSFIGSEHGFFLYPRLTFTQNKSYNKEANCHYFSNEEREEREKRVFEFLLKNNDFSTEVVEESDIVFEP